MNKLFITSIMALSLLSCRQETEQRIQKTDTEFTWEIDRFSEYSILRFQVPGFDSLNLDKKLLIYYLHKAALCGRDITFDQNNAHNIAVRKTLEAIYQSKKVDTTSNDWHELVIYLKQVWFANGIHHHYSTDKFKPGFTIEYFKKCLPYLKDSELPLQNTSRIDFENEIIKVIFDSTYMPKRVNTDASVDIIKNSANNFYEGVTFAEAETFYKNMHDKAKNKELSFGLNSKLIKENNSIQEKTYKIGDMYSSAIEKICYWLEKAVPYAENIQQKTTIETLIKYYKTGDLQEFDNYNISWVKDTVSEVDFVNGFIEVYGDAAGRKATWESIVNFKDKEATKRTTVLSENAQWFEDNSPVDSRYKKKKVKGITAKVITVATLGGDCYPTTPIGINLPNSMFIRQNYGSKSVTLENICYAYDQATQNSGAIAEFAYNQEQIDRYKKYGYVSSNLHTDLHECLGHGSGQLMPGVKSESLKNYHSTIEETRADLFALYYMMSPKIIELNLLPNIDAAKAEYDSYIRNGLMTQLKRIELGKNLEESHMRNRQLIAAWAYEQGKKQNVIEKVSKNGKTFFIINDYQKLQGLFGQLLKEIQRITSEGDYNAAQNLVETYGVKIDKAIHQEVLTRFEALHLPSYRGFINPEYTLVYDKDSTIRDVKIFYPNNYVNQMLKYSKEYSFLPIKN